MSDIDLLKRIYTAFAAGDAAPLVEALHEDVVWVEPDLDALPYRGSTTGARNVVERVLAPMATTCAHIAFTPERWIEGKALTAVLGCGSATGPGGQYAFRFAHLFTMRGGKIARMDGFADTHHLERVLAKKTA